MPGDTFRIPDVHLYGDDSVGRGRRDGSCAFGRLAISQRDGKRKTAAKPSHDPFHDGVSVLDGSTGFAADRADPRTEARSVNRVGIRNFRACERSSMQFSARVRRTSSRSFIATRYGACGPIDRGGLRKKKRRIRDEICLHLRKLRPRMAVAAFVSVSVIGRGEGEEEREGENYENVRAIPGSPSCLPIDRHRCMILIK